MWKIYLYLCHEVKEIKYIKSTLRSLNIRFKMIELLVFASIGISIWIINNILLLSFDLLSHGRKNEINSDLVRVSDENWSIDKGAIKLVFVAMNLKSCEQ